MSAINNKYLDSTGLGHLWSKIKDADKTLFKNSGLELKYSKTGEGCTNPSASGKPWMWLEAKGTDGYTMTFESAGFDASDFIVSGFLEDAIVGTGKELSENPNLDEKQKQQALSNPDTKFLLFIWNTEDGSGKKAMLVELSALTKAYTPGSGINISDGNQISAKLDGVTKGKNYLTSGDNGLSVRDMGADVTKTIGAIPIAGGALADDIDTANLPSDWKTEKGTYAIPAGKNIEQILKDLLCKEKYPAIITTTGATLVSTVAAPTINMSTSTVEVGTSVSYSVANGASNYTATPHKASGFDYGYSAANDNTKDSDNTSVSAAFGKVTVASDTSKLTLSGKATGEKSGTSAGGSATLSGSIVATEGANTLKASNTSATYSGTCNELPVYYACSNLGATSTSHVSELKTQIVKTSTPVSASDSKSFNSYYYCFYGELPVSDSIDSSKVRGLAKKLFASGSSQTLYAMGNFFDVNGGKQYVVACPPGWKLATVNNGAGAPAEKEFAESTLQVTLPNGTNVEYKVYVKKNTGGTAGKYQNLTINKG